MKLLLFFDRLAVWIYDARLMKNRLPEKVNLIQLAEQNARVEGYWPVSRMERLGSMLADNCGEVEAVLYFGKLDRLRYVKGRFQVELRAICQRCMQAMPLPLELEFKLGILTTENQEQTLPEDFEALYVEETGYCRLADVLEDELIMAMPIVPVHPYSCSKELKEYEPTQEQIENENNRDGNNPFAVLKDLL